MKAYKSKIKNTRLAEQGEFPSKFDSRYCLSVQSVYYSSTNPSQELILLDSDGDQFMRSLPGQGVERPNPYVLDTPITVSLPLKYVDTGEGNTITVWGEVNLSDRGLDSSF